MPVLKEPMWAVVPRAIDPSGMICPIRNDYYPVQYFPMHVLLDTDPPSSTRPECIQWGLGFYYPAHTVNGTPVPGRVVGTGPYRLTNKMNVENPSQGGLLPSRVTVPTLTAIPIPNVPRRGPFGRAGDNIQVDTGRAPNPGELIRDGVVPQPVVCQGTSPLQGEEVVPTIHADFPWLRTTSAPSVIPNGPSHSI